MHGRVRADEIGLPTGRRTFRVVTLQGFAVRRIVVISKDENESLLLLILNEHLPVVVADLVPELADHGAMCLAERNPGFLPFHGVGFANVDSDLAIDVTGVYAFDFARAPPLSVCGHRVVLEIE